MTPMHRPPRWAARASLVAVGLLFAACSSNASDALEDAPMLVAPSSSTAPSTTAPAAPRATTTSSTTPASTTTLAPTTTTIALPVPAPVPDAGTIEPIIELATLEIPKIGISKTMFEGVTLGTLDHGPGHWPGSALPGQIGNMVIAGHRMSHDRPFRDLDLLVPGDEMVLTDATGRHVYRVVSTEIVDPNALWILDQTPASTATLFACHPKGSTKQRIVVHLELAAV
jgi:sortase A